MGKRPSKGKGKGKGTGGGGKKDFETLSDDALREMMEEKRQEIEAIDKKLAEAEGQIVDGLSDRDDDPKRSKAVPPTEAARPPNRQSGIEEFVDAHRNDEELVELERKRREEETTLSKTLEDERGKMTRLRRISELEEREMVVHELSLKLVREEKELRRRLETHGDFKDIEEMEKYVEGWQEFLKRRERAMARRKDILLELDGRLSERGDRLEERAKELDKRQMEIKEWLGQGKDASEGGPKGPRKKVIEKGTRKEKRKGKGRKVMRK